MKKLKYVLVLALGLFLASCGSVVTEPHGDDDPVPIQPPPCSKC